MRKLWWPEPIYEMKPYGALAIGLFVALVGAARSWAAGSLDAGLVATLLFGVVSIVYATAIFRMRYRHRRDSRWNREIRR
jgi:hypothetical protein